MVHVLMIYYILKETDLKVKHRSDAAYGHIRIEKLPEWKKKNNERFCSIFQLLKTSKQRDKPIKIYAFIVICLKITTMCTTLIR